MNPTLSDAEKDAFLEVLYRGFVAIRIAGSAGDSEKAAAIADALHNVPHLVSRGHERNWTIQDLRALFLDDLLERYPDLAGIAQLLDRA